jgi:hypothetical protein
VGSGCLLVLVEARRFEVSPFSRCTLPRCPNCKRAAPSAAQSSGNLLSTYPGMLTQDALDVRLQCCFHFPLRVLKTAPSNRDGQLLANSAPGIMFQPESAILRDAGDHPKLYRMGHCWFSILVLSAHGTVSSKPLQQCYLDLRGR